MPSSKCAGGELNGSGSEDSEDELVYFGDSVLFIQKGTLVKGLPKLEPGKLYLAFDPSGVRTETLLLEFNDKSLCALGDEITSCSDPRIDNGLRVRIEGQRTREGILVQELETLDIDEL